MAISSACKLRYLFICGGHRNAKQKAFGQCQNWNIAKLLSIRKKNYSHELRTPLLSTISDSQPHTSHKEIEHVNFYDVRQFIMLRSKAMTNLPVSRAHQNAMFLFICITKSQHDIQELDSVWNNSSNEDCKWKRTNPPMVWEILPSVRPSNQNKHQYRPTQHAK